jgi:hypothetical protein
LGGLAPTASAQDQPATAREAAIERIVGDFIRFDIGQVADPRERQRIVQAWGQLNSEDAVPALVRGLNWAAQSRASCPITAISGKLNSILRNSKNPQLGTYILHNLERRDAGSYTSYIQGVHAAAEQQVMRIKGREYAQQQLARRASEEKQRMAYVPGLKLTDLAIRDPAGNGSDPSSNGRRLPPARPSNVPAPGMPPPSTSLASVKTDDLIAQLDDRTVQLPALQELHRRVGGAESEAVVRHSDRVARALKQGTPEARESAARLLGSVRARAQVPALIDALEDSDPKVRSAAATALTRTTRQLFGPPEAASATEVRQAVAKWRDWWSRESNGT